MAFEVIDSYERFAQSVCHHFPVGQTHQQRTHQPWSIGDSDSINVLETQRCTV